MGSILVICLKHIPIVDWCVIRCGSKNKHPKEHDLKEIGLHVKIG